VINDRLLLSFRDIRRTVISRNVMLSFYHMSQFQSHHGHSHVSVPTELLPWMDSNKHTYIVLVYKCTLLCTVSESVPRRAIRMTYMLCTTVLSSVTGVLPVRSGTPFEREVFGALLRPHGSAKSKIFVTCVTTTCLELFHWTLQPW
jgi:hypothetical protein